MAKETTIARESKATPINVLSDARAVRSGHTRQDYMDLYRQQRAGVMVRYSRGEINYNEARQRLKEIEGKIRRLNG